MANRQASVTREFFHLFGLGALGATSDAELMARFLAQQDDGAQAAFEVLVERHGPMVMRVCRGVLRDEHDAEDAFQATFLVLARKARFVWFKESLASWLHGVAFRVASKTRGEIMRRRRHERQACARAATEMAPESFPSLFRSDDEATISEEIARLPEKYRAPTVLCYLEAMSYRAAAIRLGLTEDALRGRLARARERLRSRLTRRGVEVSAILGATRPLIGAARPLRPGLFQATVRAAMDVPIQSIVASILTYETARTVGERIGKSMARTKFNTAVLTLALGVVAAGAVVLAQTSGGRGEERKAPAAKRSSTVLGAGSKGNLIVDWIPASPSAQKIEITVDAIRHCVHLTPVNSKRESRPNDGAVRLDLERGKTYTIAATGEAFMSPAEGPDADPFPGVMLVYGTDEEDGYAVRQAVLAPGKSVTFTTPWAINPEDEVFVMAFFLDIWPETNNRGSYRLTVTGSERRASECPFDVHKLKDAADVHAPSPPVRLNVGPPTFGSNKASCLACHNTTTFYRNAKHQTFAAGKASCLECHKSTAVVREPRPLTEGAR
jgi:RNA polymerase sigma factor (sigma-70 family)